MLDISFFKGKTVFITGHTGFKGSWMCKALSIAGAKIVGYALNPPTEPSLFALANIEKDVISIIGDIRDLPHLRKVIMEYQPEIVFHLAAQPIVRESYSNPVYTYETNVMGTVNVLEAVRCCESVTSVVIVTTDKVYENREWVWGYRENDVLNGFDPYSNSKSCAELVTNTYRNAFFSHTNVSVSTCRAGNVIGGGDFAKDRILPDCVRAMSKGQQPLLRNPSSIRPYQHVLEPVFAYLLIAQKQYENKEKYEGCYNIGPEDCDCITTGKLVDLFCTAWEKGSKWMHHEEANAPHEAGLLKLDCTKLKTVFGWRPCWDVSRAIDMTVRWSKVYLQGEDIIAEMESQIKEYLSRIGENSH